MKTIRNILSLCLIALTFWSCADDEKNANFVNTATAPTALAMQFEDDVPWPGVTGSAEITVATTVANQWETLTFDHSGIDLNIDWYNMVLIMDNGTVGDGSANYTIFLDDITIN